MNNEDYEANLKYEKIVGHQDKQDRKQFVLDSEGKICYKSFAIDDPRDKTEMYCVKCEEPVIICNGEVRDNYIRHKSGTRNDCDFYATWRKKKDDDSSEGTCNTLELGTLCYLLKHNNLQVHRKCDDCDIVEPHTFEDKPYKVRSNYTYTKEDGLETTSDVVLKYDGKVCVVFELCDGKSYNTDYDKPNTAKWFKLYKPDIMKIHEVEGQVDDHNILICCRRYRCKPCEDIAIEEINKQKRIKQELSLERIKQIQIQLELERERERVAQCLELERIKEIEIQVELELERKKKDAETCPCGAYRKPPFKVCFKCNQSNQSNKTSKCITCSKSIDGKYTKCYSCGKKDICKPTSKYLF